MYTKILSLFSRSNLILAVIVALGVSGAVLTAFVSPVSVSAACNPSTPEDCTNPSTCRSNGGTWDNKIDGGICIPPSCTTVLLSNCRTREACNQKGGLYVNATGSTFMCTTKNKLNCESAGGTWTIESTSCSVGDTDPGASPPASGPAVEKSCGKDGKQGGSFFGLPTWYKYLELNDQCEVQNFKLLGSDSSLPLIGLAIMEMAFRIGAIVAVVFVVIGGIKFVTSQGEPEDVKSARNTVLNALIGLVITLIAVPVVVFIGNRFGG